MLGMRFEAADSQSEQFKNATVQTVEVNGKHYIDAFAGNDFGKRVFDENKHYLHPIPVNVRSKNPKLGQNPNW
ncbi:MAG: RagB/SusD family nutrient uptake outer membrane protein [Parabacteroides sp.]|nr:RagB/SusD family nutrient uptake outer membrane protein [Parabacteroides sp.]